MKQQILLGFAFSDLPGIRSNFPLDFMQYEQNCCFALWFHNFCFDAEVNNTPFSRFTDHLRYLSVVKQTYD